MNFVKVDKRNKVVCYPYSVEQLRADNPNMSLPVRLSNVMLKDYNVYPVVNMQKPAYKITESTVVEGMPELIDGAWCQTWKVVPITQADDVDAAYNEIIAELEPIVKNRLDNHAKEHGYDSILSACSYVNSSVEKFKNEALYCIGLRDATWSMFYTIMTAIKGGNTTTKSQSDLELLLPPLEWPSADQ